MMGSLTALVWGRLCGIASRLAGLAPKGGLRHATFALGGVTFFGQVVAVGLAPVYSRFYSPADYGVFGAFTSIVTTVLTIGSLSYEQGIPISKDDHEAARLTAMSIFIVIVSGFAALAGLWLAALMGMSGLVSQLGHYVWFVPIGILGAGACRALNYWALRRQAMGAIARTAVFSIVCSNSVNLACGALAPSPMGLVLATVTGYCASIVGLVRRSGLAIQLRETGESVTALAQIWAVAKKYKRLALVQAPSTLFNSLGIYLPGLLAVPYCGVDFAGQLFMALKLIALPSSLIGVALSQVFYSGAAAVARERPEELEKFFDKVFVRGLAGSVLIVMVGVVAPWGIPVALGARWGQAGEIAFWFSLYEAIGFSVSALSSIPNVVGRLNGQFAINVARATAVLVLFVLKCRLGFSGMTLVKAYAAVMIVNYAACFMLYKHQARVVSRTGITGWTKPGPVQ